MNYESALIFLLGGLGLSAGGIYFFLSIYKQKKLQRLQKIPFQEEYRRFLLKIPQYKNLSSKDKKKIEHSILIFVYTKEFIGVDLEITDEMKIVIGFYACLLLLHIDTKNCYENLSTIIVYPTTVMTTKESYIDGIYSKEKLFIDGQSSNDTVVLIWDDIKREIIHPRHSNVIVHEFAHEIDFMDGKIDGIPPLEKSKYNEWTHTIFKDFDTLQKITKKDRDWGRYKFIGKYAATNEAEFFAVISERFFESPHSLKIKFPELYNELKNFYKTDTIELIEG